MQMLQELHIHTQGSPVVSPTTTLASYSMQSIVSAIMFGGDPWQWGNSTLNYAAVPGEHIGNEWQLNGMASCYQIMPNDTGDEWVCCVYPDGQVVLLVCDELSSAYLITGHEL
jgi:hypothetical protein